MGLTKPRAAQIYNLDYKQATRVVTVVNITLSGGAPNQVDGVNLSLNDRVLVTAQTTGSQNGLYRVTTVGAGSNGTWARTSDGNETGEIEAGMLVMVTEGTIYADTQWKLTTDDPIVIGTTTLTFVQNYSANSISSGTSNVVVNANANVTISSAGTANVVLVSSTGIVVAGNIVPSANVTYSLGTTSQRFSNLWLSNTTIYLGDINLSATETTLTVNGANVLVGNAGAAFSTSGNITGGNVLTGGLISATGNVTGNYFLGNVFFANGITASKIYSGNSEVNVVSSGGNANISIGGTSNVVVFATTGEYVTGVISASGDVTAGNVLTGGLISATGNVTGNYINGNIYFANGFSASKIFNGTSEANIGTSGGNANISIGGTSNVVVFATTGEYVTGLLSVTGNVTAGNISATTYTGTTASVTGTTTAASVVGGVITGSSTSVTGTTTAASVVGGVITGSSTSVTGTTTAASVVGGVITGTSTSVTGTTTAASVVGGVITGTSASVSGNVTSGNVLTGGVVSATANVTGGNVLTGGVISAAGNITGNYLLGNASQVTGVNTFNQIFVTGATTVNAASLTSNVTFAGGSNIELTSDGATITIAYSAVASSSIFATGGDMGLIADPVTESEDLGTVIVVADTSYDLGDLFTTVTYNQIDMTGFTSNINTGNLNAVGLVSAVGNVTGNYIYGNGSQLTGIAGGTSVINGTSNIVVGSSANITLAVAGTSNVVIFTTTGMSATGNITGNYFVGNGAALTGITSTPPPLNINLQQNYGGF
jgi:hypothetical protein